MNNFSKIDKTLPTINLFGDEEENFYQLGLKDQDSAKYALSMIRELISTRWPSVNILIHNALSQILDKIILTDREYGRLLNAYAEGAGLDSKDLQSALMIPEICSFLGPMTKYISPLNFGCSSIFTTNNNNQPVHIRILDFPLKNTYDLHERIVVTHFKNQYKCFNFSSAGLPFSGLTSMNDQGLTIALHQKFTDDFNQHGLPIFYIAHKIITSCKNCAEARAMIEDMQSITCWNINLMDKDGNILEVDIKGQDKIINEYKIHEIGHLYLCNQVLDQSAKISEIIPLGMNHYNNIRIQNSKNLKKITSKSNVEIIKQIATPNNKNLCNYNQLTPSTMACVLFDPSLEEIHYIPGEAPKTYINTVAHIKNLWTSQDVKLVTKNKSENLRAKEFYNHLILAQHYFDISNATECYHHLQMAFDFCENNEEHILKLFFIAAQYVYEPHTKALAHLNFELSEIYSELPEYLKDVAKILGQRICLLSGENYLLDKNFSNLKLEERFYKEQSISNINHQILRRTTFLHLDVLDVIFV